jgi:uncharacterized repeat protein (TIGR01451 family)
MKTRRIKHPILYFSQSSLFRIGILITLGILLAVPIYRVSSASLSRRTAAGPQAASKSPSVTTENRRTTSSSSFFAPVPFIAGIQTFAADCTTPKSEFELGDVICATVTGATDQPRRLTFVDPSGFIRQVTAISSDPQNVTFTIPNTETSTINEQTVDNRGTWRINVISTRGFVVAATTFVVTDPANKSADLSIFKLVSSSQDQVAAGSAGTFQIFIANSGPDDATNVVLTDVIPANTTFGAMIQTSGPTFSCTTPAVGSGGTVTCTRATLARGDSASFDFGFTVNAGTAVGTTITNTATVTSDISDPNTVDNTSSASVRVSSTGGGGGSTCSVGCPDDITTQANTTDNGQDGAIVHFSPPSGNDECGPIVVSHCNDCFFPVGITTVTASAASGESCSFRVTVNAPNSGNVTISCPGNQTADADSNCEANVAVGTATATGDNVTVTGTRSDGQPMYDCTPPEGPNYTCTRKATDAPFSAGVTTITWIAYSHDVAGPYASADDEEAHRNGSATCTQTITVNDVTPPNIAATDSTASADANCQAPVPDYSSTVSDNCACGTSDNSPGCEGHPHITYSQSPAAGTMVGLGPHTVHIQANDGSSNNGGAGNTSTKDVTFTVVDNTPPTFTFVPPAITAYTGPGATTCDAVVDPGMATASDNCASVTITRSPSGNTFPVGTTTITWTATDGNGNSTTATQTITVIDNTPPTITTNGVTPSMWPPNHKYQTFTPANFVASVSDNCGGVSVSNVVIAQVTSDETENGNGDGNTLNDIVISSDCKSVQLRSERDGGGNGRVYTITLRLTDTHGNTTTATARVVVPHNPGETAVDSGVHYTVTGSCP